MYQGQRSAKRKEVNEMRQSELAVFMNQSSTGKFQPAISEYKGRFFFVGSIPESLGTWGTNKIGQAIFNSNHYDSREAAQAALDAVKQ